MPLPLEEPVEEEPLKEVLLPVEEVAPVEEEAAPVEEEPVVESVIEEAAPVKRKQHH